MSKNDLKIFCDGGARGNPGPAAAAFVVFSGNKTLAKEGKYLGSTTNNQAEYNAVLLAMKWLLKNKSNIDGKKVDFYLDSELVVKQLMGEYKVIFVYKSWERSENDPRFCCITKCEFDCARGSWFVIPEVPLGTIVSLLGMFAAIPALLVVKRVKSK